MPNTFDETTPPGTAVVIGAGTMGRGIAADIANAGWRVYLWDIRREIAEQAKARLIANRPPLLFLDGFAGRIIPGTLDDLPLLANADWVVEAVAESLPVKREVFDRIEPHLGAKTLVTSNTSGLSLNQMASGRGKIFRQRFFGTHFLNPPRYLKLLEVIPTAHTDPEILARFVRFAEDVLGHRVVIARDTPGFISTRFWITHLMDTIHATLEAGVDFAAVDALTGPLIGRPRSATFRMADVVGLDIIAAIAANQYAALPADPLRERLQLPPLLTQMLDRGWTGEKAGAGFYRRVGKTILTLDSATMEYHPRNEMVGQEAMDLVLLPLPQRLQALKSRQRTPAINLLNTLLDRLTQYAEEIGPQIAADVLSIDRTMQWGFGWEMGPFALADCRTGQATNYAGQPPQQTFRVFPHIMRPCPDEPKYISLAERKASGGLVETCATASLVDVGEKVYCVEFHSKMNTLGPEICDFLRRAVDRAERDKCELVIGNQGAHFCAGYDLTRLFTHMESRNWAAIDAEMNACQQAFHTLQYAPVRVLAAVHGFTLGGGAEVALHCGWMLCAPELAISLPEALVGLIPCGGGTKEVLRLGRGRPGIDADPLAIARYTLKTIARPRVTTNAYDARQQGWLHRVRSGICANPDRLLYDAHAVFQRAKGWYPDQDPQPVPIINAGGLDILRADIERWRSEGDSFTAHDAHIADTIARLLSGDGASTPTLTEQEYFDLERRLFLELCREPLTQARTKHLLETGKHLRN